MPIVLFITKAACRLNIFSNSVTNNAQCTLKEDSRLTVFYKCMYCTVCKSLLLTVLQHTHIFSYLTCKHTQTRIHSISCHAQMLVCNTLHPSSTKIISNEKANYNFHEAVTLWYSSYVSECDQHRKVFYT